MDERELAQRLNWQEKDVTTFRRLREGVLSEEDPVTWRTLLFDSLRLLGVEDPEFGVVAADKYEDALLLRDELLAETWLEELKPEWTRETGITIMTQAQLEALNKLFVNARHCPEPLLYSLARLSRDSHQRVAVINSVGHYSDLETRIVFPNMEHKIEHLVFVASTQRQYGGSFEVLSKVTRWLRNPDLAQKVQKVDVVVPMWGGSRGHKAGQRYGWEVQEAKANPKILAVLMRDIINALVIEERIKPPRVRFVTVDVHHEQSLKEVFDDAGFEFVNADPMPEIAWGVQQILDGQGIGYLPKKVIACDLGALARSRQLVQGYFWLDKTLPYIDLVRILKKRKNGVIEKAWVDRIERIWRDGRVEDAPVDSITEVCNGVEIDDMMDTGGTASKDTPLVRGLLPRMKALVYAATHLVVSKGVDTALNKVGADFYVFGNTLDHRDLQRNDVLVMDMAPAILRAIE